MRSYKEFLAEKYTIRDSGEINEAVAKKKETSKKKESAKKDKSTDKINCMQEIVAELKNTFKHYSLTTRKYVWEKLISTKGKELVGKLVHDPMIYRTTSPFTQLVTDTKK
jgi:hypothetical protein